MSTTGQIASKFSLNVKQTKNEYSKVNNLALRGFEVSTYYKDEKDSKEVVSHIKKAIFDYLSGSCYFYGRRGIR